MFGVLFGWPKAAKCKKMINRARCRLRQLKNRRQAMVTIMRKDLTELIQNDQEENAVKRVEQLIQDESLVAAYELLDHFLELIHRQISYIRKHKDCPNDINEAVSSVIFASARCGGFPELYVIKKLFAQRYGEVFATAAVELFPGNLVNKKFQKQLIENLSVKSVPDDLKYRVIGEIARDNGFQPKVKECEGNQIVESDAQINNSIAGSKIHTSEVEEIERDLTCVGLSITKPSDVFSLPEPILNDTSALVSTVQLYPPFLSYPLQEKVEKVEDFLELIFFETSDLQNKGEIKPLSCLERVSFLPYAEEMVEYVDDIEECQFLVSKDGSKEMVEYVDDIEECQFFESKDGLKDMVEYVDDIEECQFFVSKDGSCQDQRLLFDSDESDTHLDESTSEKSSIRSSTRSNRASKKRLRRSALLERQGIMEIEYKIYYQKPCKRPSTQKYGTRYHRGISQLQKRLKQHTSSEKENCIQSCQSQGSSTRNSFNFNICDCSLDRPCYCCVYNDQECWEALSMELKKEIRSIQIQQGVLLGEFCHCRPFCHDESNKGMETATPYSRALTMPPEWPKNCTDNLLRTYSCTFQRPKYVHPMLPEYEDIVATFTALKREWTLREKLTAAGSN